MASHIGGRLVDTCDSLCEELRSTIGLTSFRVELDRRPTPLVIRLQRRDPLPFDPRHEWMRPTTPAAIERPILHGERRIGSLQIEDARRPSYPDDAVAAVERILPTYAATLAGLLQDGQL